MLHCRSLKLTKNANINGAAEWKVRSCKDTWLLVISKLIQEFLCEYYRPMKYVYVGTCTLMGMLQIFTLHKPQCPGYIISLQI